MPRIVGGIAKGRKLLTLKGDVTRPTGAKVKEALFSILRPHLSGAFFLDLFAGSGQMGLEAKSQGAGRVLMVEQHPKVASLIRKNVAHCGLDAEVWTMPAQRALGRLLKEGAHVDLLYVDPPWHEEGKLLAKMEAGLASILNPLGWLIVEGEADLQEALKLKAFRLERACHYGRAVVFFYRLMEEGWES